MQYANVTGGGLKIRQEASKEAAVLTLIPNNSRIAITEKGDVWSKAIYNQYTGYVMTKYLKFEDDESSEIDTVTITLRKDIAEALYEALKNSLES